MKKHNLQAIMISAWALHRKLNISFSESLHRSWLSEKAYPINEQRIADAMESAGVSEECHTWYGWKQMGREVRHGSKALFGVTLIYGSMGDGATYKARFFGSSQVQEAM